MINKPIENPTPKVMDSINTMCNYLTNMHKCPNVCSECPLVKTLNFLNKYV